MQFSSLKIQYRNGQVKIFPYSCFDLYASIGELEHKEENIIVPLSDLSHSFIYETDELYGEIVNKEYVEVLLLP